VILDISIDQGGCVATSRPTTLAQPTFVHSGVIHYCVPNMTANIARTATAALSHSSLPYLLRIANEGIDRALHHSPDLAKGVYTFAGQCVNPVIAEIFGAKPAEIYSLLGEEIWS
jgi:alanine dehydrogenase